ncbi:MAG: acyl-CoA dehydrogenase family protein [Acidobacteria bacterium]|nr:acyl-CoA dehydrogenase family protein [Acidobacteriota bacterium]
MTHFTEYRGIEGINYFDQDRGLQLLLRDWLPEVLREEIFASLQNCAGHVTDHWFMLAQEGNRPEQLPRIVNFDRVGNRVDGIDFGPHTRQLRRDVAQETGLFTRTRNDLHHFALIYFLAHNGEASLTCPISCTDGLIRAIVAKGSEYLKATYLEPLCSAHTPFAGAQFVTERVGGSDVGAIEMEARPNEDGTWSLTGDKWFCSNPDEFFAVAARPTGAPAGTDGVALFMVPRVLPDGTQNRIVYHRLKDKLGTRSLPTAELVFDGATGWLIGDAHDGFKTLMHYVLNTSRIHNAVNASGFLRRAFLEGRNYARQRTAFGQTIENYPLVQETLVTLLERVWRYRLLTFKLISLVDEHGLSPADTDQSMWQRFLVNLAKYRTAENLTASIHDATMLFGGNGIVEDFTILPRLVRDAMIIETWEGAHNTLCLQILRDAARSTLFDRWQAEIQRVLDLWPVDFLAQTKARFISVLAQVKAVLDQKANRDRQWVAVHARRMVDSLGSLLEVAWMVELAVTHREADATPAVLAAVAVRDVFASEDRFESLLPETLWPHVTTLIDETPFQMDVSNI